MLHITSDLLCHVGSRVIRVSIKYYSIATHYYWMSCSKNYVGRDSKGNDKSADLNCAELYKRLENQKSRVFHENQNANLCSPCDHQRKSWHTATNH